MPNIQSAKKSLRQTAKRMARNRVRKEAYKSLIKAALKDKDQKSLSLAQKALDKAAKAGVIKKNTAARRLSRLMKKVGAKK
jgi:small subunit ribosomal protein S20